MTGPLAIFARRILAALLEPPDPLPHSRSRALRLLMERSEPCRRAEAEWTEPQSVKTGIQRAMEDQA